MWLEHGAIEPRDATILYVRHVCRSRHVAHRDQVFPHLVYHPLFGRRILGGGGGRGDEDHDLVSCVLINRDETYLHASSRRQGLPTVMVHSRVALPFPSLR